jgi:hypothetical protein
MMPSGDAALFNQIDSWELSGGKRRIYRLDPTMLREDSKDSFRAVS